MSKGKLIDDALTDAFQKVASEALKKWPAGKEDAHAEEPDENTPLRKAARAQLAGRPDADALAFAAFESPEKLTELMEGKLKRQCRFLWISLIAIALLVFLGICAILYGLLFSVTGSLAVGAGSTAGGITFGGLLSVLYGQPWKALVEREKALDLARAKNIAFVLSINECKQKARPVPCIKEVLHDYEQWRRNLD